MDDTHWIRGPRPRGLGLILAASAALVPACTGDDTGETDDPQADTSGDASGGTRGSTGDGGSSTADSSTSADGSSGSDGSDGSDTEGSDPFAALLEFLGGEPALTRMTGFRSTASGLRAVANEGQHAGDPAMQTGTFDSVTAYDLVGDAARVDYERFNEFLGGVPVSYAEVYRGSLGYVAGDDGVIFPGPNDSPMPSSRWASGRKQLTLLNPHLLVLDVLAGSRAMAVSDQAIEGCDAVLEVDDAVSPIHLCVLEGGELTGLHTMVNDFLLRDVELSVDYAGWDGDGVRFPTEVGLRLDGDVVHSETREVEVDPRLDPSGFELPAEGRFDRDLAHYGETTHQFFQTFSAMGIPLDFPPVGVVATEISPGVHHLTGATHHTLVVEQTDRVIVIEAPNRPARGEAVLSWIARNIPGKAVTHVIATHHHEDHTAGLRAFVAAQVEVVMHEASVDYFADEVFTAPSTIVPDALAGAAVAPQITGVGAAGLVLDDPQNPITLGHLPNGHSADMLLIEVAAADPIVFVSDIYNPGNGGSAFDPAWAQQLLDALAGTGPTTMIAGGHGTVAPLQELVDFVGG